MGGHGGHQNDPSKTTWRIWGLRGCHFGSILGRFWLFWGQKRPFLTPFWAASGPLWPDRHPPCRRVGSQSCRLSGTVSVWPPPARSCFWGVFGCRRDPKSAKWFSEVYFGDHRDHPSKGYGALMSGSRRTEWAGGVYFRGGFWGGFGPKTVIFGHFLTPFWAPLGAGPAGPWRFRPRAGAVAPARGEWRPSPPRVAQRGCFWGSKTTQKHEKTPKNDVFGVTPKSRFSMFFVFFVFSVFSCFCRFRVRAAFRAAGRAAGGQVVSVVSRIPSLP